MLRRTLSGVAALATLAVAVVSSPALVGSPAGAARYNGAASVACTSVTLPGSFTFDRDNTGRRVEALQVRVTDGAGTLLATKDIGGPLGTYNLGPSLLTFPPPVSNPIKVLVVSLAGNKLTAKVALAATGRCNARPAAFVKAAYQDLLGRKPTAAELRAELYAQGVGAQDHDSVAARLAGSDERLGLLVNKLYLATLGRRGDRNGVSYWVAQLRLQRKTLPQVTASFYASEEYFLGLGGGTYDTWVRDMYVKLLQRPADDPGVAHWVAVARRSRTPVALTFFQSPESRRTRVIDLYRQLLGRGPSAAELAAATAALVTTTDLRLAADLVAGNEFDQRANARFP